MDMINEPLTFWTVLILSFFWNWWFDSFNLVEL